MLSTWKHEPLTQPNNSIITERRKQLVPFIIENNSSITVQDPTQDELPRTCFYYAIKKTTGFTTPLEFYPGSSFLTTIDIEDYFEQTKKPILNGLAVYTTSKDDLTIQHFAVIVATDELLLKSKWGLYPLVVTHKPFTTPFSYGTAIGFFALKKKYTTSNKRLLHDTLQCAAIKKNLFQLTAIGGPLFGLCFLFLLFKNIAASI